MKIEIQTPAVISIVVDGVPYVASGSAAPPSGGGGTVDPSYKDGKVLDVSDPYKGGPGGALRAICANVDDPQQNPVVYTIENWPGGNVKLTGGAQPWTINGQPTNAIGWTIWVSETPNGPPIPGGIEGDGYYMSDTWQLVFDMPAGSGLKLNVKFHQVGASSVCIFKA